MAGVSRIAPAELWFEFDYAQPGDKESAKFGEAVLEPADIVAEASWT